MLHIFFLLLLFLKILPQECHLSSSYVVLLILLLIHICPNTIMNVAIARIFHNSTERSFHLMELRYKFSDENPGGSCVFVLQ